MKTILPFMISLVIGLTSQGQTQIGNDIDGEATGDNFGFSTTLSTDGTTIAVGAPFNDGNGTSAGHVRVFQNTDESWTQLGDDIDGEFEGDQTGQSVSLSADGSLVAIGEPLNDENGSLSGQVRVFENTLGNWTQVGGDINGDSGNAQMGGAVDLSADGTILAVGSRGASVEGIGDYTGHVRVYENQDGEWMQIGNDMTGESQNDYFGVSLSISSDGSTVAVGARGYVFSPANGYVNVYKNVDGVWTQIGESILGNTEGGHFGQSVALSSDGNILAVGGPFETTEGTVRVYENTGGTWTALGSDLLGENPDDKFGHSISISGDGTLLAVGAPGVNSWGVDAGTSYLYQNQAGEWVNVYENTNGENPQDQSGFSVSLSSDASTFAIGATKNGDDAGHVRVYSLETIVSAEDLPPIENISIYPNPSNDVIRVHALENQIAVIEEYSLTGRLTYSGPMNSNPFILNTKDFLPGSYILRMTDVKGEITNTMIVIH